MYVIGHCVVTERSGLFSSAELYEEGIFGLMFPDYVRCHDWGYGCCFEPWWDESPVSERMIQAHLLGDYFVHYGSRITDKRREGWAYRNMGPYARRYEEFFSRATASGLREPGPAADSIRGFSHTMVEYTIDTYLAEKGCFDTAFDGARAALGGLGSSDPTPSKTWVDETIAKYQIGVNPTDLSEDLSSFGSRIQISQRPEEFAFNAGVKKFQLKPCEESRQLLREFLTDGMSEIGRPSIEQFVNACAEFISERMTSARATATVN